MSNTHLSLRIHLVWATKNRRPWLDPEWRSRLFACMDGRRVGRGNEKQLLPGFSMDLRMGVRMHLRRVGQSFRYSRSLFVWARLTGISVLFASFIRRM